MPRYIAASLFLAVAVILSVMVGDVFAAGGKGQVTKVFTTGADSRNGEMSGCPSGTTDQQKTNQQSCCEGLFCTTAMDMTKPSGVLAAFPVSGVINPVASDFLTGRNVVPETGPPKLIV